MNSTQNYRYIIFFMSVVVFTLSLFSSPVTFAGDDNPKGYFILLTGWAGIIFNGPAACSWLSNVFIFYTWINFGIEQKKNSAFKTIFLSLFCCCLAASFLLITEVSFPLIEKPAAVTKIHIGYYVWLFSMTIMFFGSLLVYFLEKNKKN